MSLLEDIFLGDEANEAQELERVIDGDDYDERRRSRSRTPDSNSNSEKEDEAEEDKRRVDPVKPKKVIKNPRQVLNYVRLTGPRGISIIPNHFKDFKFKGKGHEKEDLDLVLKKLEHWAYRLYPKFKFEDCLKKIETLGKKQAVSVHVRKIRSDQLTTDEPIIQKDSSDDEDQPEEQDEFDKLLQQQIDLARATPAPDSVRKGFMTPGNRNFAAPKATSSPSINDEQRERMLRNRQLAEERRLARLKLTSDNSYEDSSTVTDVNKPPNVEIDMTVEQRVGSVTGEIDLTDVKEKAIRKHNRSNIIDSSDEEDVMTINQSISVDVHLEKKDKNDKENINISGEIKSNNNSANSDNEIENKTEDLNKENCNETEINGVINNEISDTLDINNDETNAHNEIEIGNLITNEEMNIDFDDDF